MEYCWRRSLLLLCKDGNRQGFFLQVDNHKSTLCEQNDFRQKNILQLKKRERSG
ncbi:hypothetical protein H206_05184 [Candidatus Electrothrix aarhusensis]|uniref:Uncharacterized protein n=1 Tax=Candidatus Electrothrix aarhusensis TaxID=1859131 RepID=A0A3S3SR68_9BACT|nr:hypothetical protein H206_05184 [Candidatus Electrothrix aarhusensis]